MKVRAVFNVGLGDYPGGLVEGQEVELPDEMANRFISRGWVVPAEEETTKKAKPSDKS